jgi:ABC-2 type transport system ATP-binding protein
MKRQQLLPISAALAELHLPASPSDPKALNAFASGAHRSVIFEELFFLELGLAMRKRAQAGGARVQLPSGRRDLRGAMRGLLPFKLTGAQERVLAEIEQEGEPDRPNLEVEDLVKVYPDGTRAVDGVSFEVAEGALFGFLGPNGAGKSTTLRMLLGLVRPTDGEATVLGLPYRSLDRPTRSVGAVLETQSFHPQRSGRNHLRVLAAASGIPVWRVDEVLDQVGLTGKAGLKVAKYSLGMRQRLGLAGALLGEPGVQLLDEPANGLDPKGIRWLRELLRAVAGRGNAVLISSHLLAEMAQLADDVIVIHRGRLIRQSSVRELTNGGGLLRVGSPEPARLAAALEAQGMSVQRDGDGRLRVRHGSAQRVGAVALREGIPLVELANEQGTLEDVFLELTNEEAAR